MSGDALPKMKKRLRIGRRSASTLSSGNKIGQSLDFIQHDKALQGSEGQFRVRQSAKVSLAFQVECVTRLFPRLLKLSGQRRLADLPRTEDCDHGELLEKARQAG